MANPVDAGHVEQQPRGPLPGREQARDRPHADRLLAQPENLGRDHGTDRVLLRQGVTGQREEPGLPVVALRQGYRHLFDRLDALEQVEYPPFLGRYRHSRIPLSPPLPIIGHFLGRSQLVQP